jgi:hypothetical protein
MNIPNHYVCNPFVAWMNIPNHYVCNPLLLG